MLNQTKKKLDDLYHFDPASYVNIARKIVAEYEKSKSAHQKYLSCSQPVKHRNIIDLYVNLTIKRII
ncbi:MAG: hypothetical protein ACXABU_16965 [Candidatus Hodarchaeales archaeon]